MSEGNQTRKPTGFSRGYLTSTFNPPLRKSHWINQFVSIHKKKSPYNGMHFFKPCYLDMDRDMLGEYFYIEADLLRKEHEAVYCHEYLGIPMED